MKKVLFICRFYDPHKGGVETHIQKVVEQLLQKDYSITIITLQYAKDLQTLVTRDGITIIRIPLESNRLGNRFETFNKEPKLFIWKWFIENRKLVAGFDIVHVHDVMWYIWPLIFLYKLQAFITFHGYETKAPKFRHVFHRKLNEYLALGSIGIGRFMQKWYKHTFTIVSYGAADRSIPAKSQASSSAMSLVFVGRIEKDTGVKQYVGLINNLAKKVNISADFLGDGQLYKELKEESLSANSPLVLHGWVENTETYVAKADVVLSSSYLSILEAMQTKKLVVAVFDSEIKRDYLLSHPMRGNMIVGDDPDKIATTLLSLTNRQKQEMVEQAYEWAKMQTWEKLTNQYIALWQNK